MITSKVWSSKLTHTEAHQVGDITKWVKKPVTIYESGNSSDGYFFRGDLPQKPMNDEHAEYADDDFVHNTVLLVDYQILQIFREEGKKHGTRILALSQIWSNVGRAKI